MTIGNIIDALERFSPLVWQEEYDNSGLQVGLFDETGLPLGRDAVVTGVLVCLDITEAVIDEAVARGCNLVVSHHPLIFRPLKNVSGITYQQRCVAKALRLGIALYAAHTNLDNAPGGVSWEMASRLGLQNLRPLVPLTAAPAASQTPDQVGGDVSAAAVFTPVPPVDTSVPGVPAASEAAVSVTASEAAVSVSTPVVSGSSVMPGPDRASLPSPACPSAFPGSGVIGVLPQPVPAEDFVRTLAAVFNAPHLRFCLPTASFSSLSSEVADALRSTPSSPSAGADSSPLIRTVALCGGSGGEYIPDAIAAGADCYVTGEIRYHDYFEAEGCMLVALGHYESEQYTMDLLCRKLQEIISREIASSDSSRASCDPSNSRACASLTQPSFDTEHMPIVLKTTLDTNPLRSL